MNAMTQKDYKQVCNNRYTLVAFDSNGKRVGTRSNFPMHQIMEMAIKFTSGGLTVKIWDQDTAEDLKIFSRSDRIEDYQSV